MEKYRACDIAVVAIILNNLFTKGSCGSTARSSEAAKALLDLKEQSQKPGMSEASHLSSQRHIATCISMSLVLGPVLLLV